MPTILCYFMALLGIHGYNIHDSAALVCLGLDLLSLSRVVEEVDDRDDDCDDDKVGCKEAGE